MPEGRRVKGWTFDEWKAEVNRRLGVFGLHADDLPDWGYYDAWEAGMPPVKAARKALKAAKDF